MDEVKALIKEKLKTLPMCPGVYFMKDADGTILYVGKSKLLKNRVSQYFMESKNHSPKTLALVSHIADFDYMVTDTEVEALVLECNMIKKYRPKYNILLKDDKHYPYIKITMQEPFPRIYMTRKVLKDGAKYFGPYMSAWMVKEILELIKKIFLVRSCNKNLPKDIGKGRPCLYYHIGQCSAPCTAMISQEEYQEIFDQIADVLSGKFEALLNLMTEKMKSAAEHLAFEKAARYRDKIESLRILGEKQKMLSTQENNRDIIGLYHDETETCVQIFYVRDGKVSGTEYFVFDSADGTEEEVLSEFLKQYYFNATMIPREILIPKSVEDAEEIEAWFRQKTDHKISLHVPRRGEKYAMMKMVNQNAKESLEKHRFRRNRDQRKQNDILSQLTDLLALKSPPHRIESYDISNLSGAQSIGVCVTYVNAKESKGAYRKFNIKTVEGANDYESMREVIYRRFHRAYEEEDAIKKGSLAVENAKFLPLPDLILLDGGKGHVHAIRTLMDTLGETVPVYGLVKDDKHRTRGITDDTTEFSIDKDGELFRFLSCMQDEVHRFAISGFRKKHETYSIHSELEDIPGIGPEKRKKILQTFLSIDRLKSATQEELRSILDKKSADNVWHYIHGGKTEHDGKD